jgi:hypothetical protein
MSASPRQIALIVFSLAAVGLSLFLFRSPKRTPEDLERFPVSGRITVEGKALPKGNVLFIPDVKAGTKHMYHPGAVIDADGRYELSNEGRPGAPAGTYRVVILATFKPIPERPQDWVPDWMTHVRYTDAASTDLVATVPATDAQATYDFDLKK